MATQASAKSGLRASSFSAVAQRSMLMIIAPVTVDDGPVRHSKPSNSTTQSPGGHWLLQAPQLFTLLDRSTQPWNPPQLVCPGTGQTHWIGQIQLGDERFQVAAELPGPRVRILTSDDQPGVYALFAQKSRRPDQEVVSLAWVQATACEHANRSFWFCWLVRRTAPEGVEVHPHRRDVRWRKVRADLPFHFVE